MPRPLVGHAEPRAIDRSEAVSSTSQAARTQTSRGTGTRRFDAATRALGQGVAMSSGVAPPRN